MCPDVNSSPPLPHPQLEIKKKKVTAFDKISLAIMLYFMKAIAVNKEYDPQWNRL